MNWRNQKNILIFLNIFQHFVTNHLSYQIHTTIKLWIFCLIFLYHDLDSRPPRHQHKYRYHPGCSRLLFMVEIHSQSSSLHLQQIIINLNVFRQYMFQNFTFLRNYELVTTWQHKPSKQLHNDIFYYRINGE